MLEKYLKKVDFTSQKDFETNYELIVPKNFNFAYDIIDEWATIAPNKRALCWTNDQGEHIDFSYAELKQKSDETAAYFQSLGIGKGDMVMLILKRRYEFWYAIIALHKLGAVSIPATHLLTEKDIIYRCNSADIKAIVCVGDENITKHIDLAVPKCTTLTSLVSIGPHVPKGYENFHKGIEEAAPFIKPANPSNNKDISLLYFTSGTTGEPKMVTHDYVYPLGHIVTAKYWHNLHKESLHLTVADTGWGKAVWGKLYGQMIVGAAVFIYDHDKFTPADMLQMIEKYKITSFCAPPTIFRFMIREDLRKYNLKSLQWGTIAGEALNPSVYNQFNELTGIKLREGFGQTETTCTIMTSPWMEPKPGSMGRPNPAYKVDIILKDGSSAEAGEQGEIVIYVEDNKKPEGLFIGYYKDEKQTKRAFNHGIYHTGDVAWKDEDGYYWFVGRNDDVIKSSGYRIGPFEVESALLLHDAVAECAITAVPDDIRGQIVKATIVLGEEYEKEEKEALIQLLQDHVKRTTAPYKYPRVIEFVKELPKTISGKIRRVEIRNNDKNK